MGLLDPLLAVLSLGAKDPDGLDGYEPEGSFFGSLFGLVFTLIKLILAIPAALVMGIVAYVRERGRCPLWGHLLLLIAALVMSFCCISVFEARWPFLFGIVLCLMTVLARRPEGAYGGFVTALQFLIRWIFRIAAGIALYYCVRGLFGYFE